MEKKPLKLLENLECPICTDYLTLPIRQCVTGHSVCGKCVERLDQCALCESAFTDSRNFALEALAVKMMYPCINVQSGCTKLLSYSERNEHEITCSFQNFQIACQMKGCSFVGDTTTLKCHWKEKKTSSKIYGAFNKCNLKIKQESYYVNLVEAFGRMFWFKSKIANGLIYFAMQFIGKPEEAHMFFYQIEVFHESLPKKRIIVSDYCKSIALGNEELFNEEICIIVFIRSIKLFLADAESSPKLNYVMRLCKVGGNSRKKKGRQYPPKFNNVRRPPSSKVITLQNLSGEVSRSGNNINNSATTTLPVSTEHVYQQENQECSCCSLCNECCAIS